MKKLVKVPVVTVTEVTEEKDTIIEEDGGMLELLGKNVCILACNYIYYGKLVGVNGSCIMLENAGIVYSTGEWSLPNWKDFQKLPTKQVYVKTEAIESFFEVNK